MQNDEILEKRNQWWLNNFGDKTPFKTNHFKETAKKTTLNRYGEENIAQTEWYHDNVIGKYVYNGVSFDSSWELSVWIYFTDNNIPIEREPCRLFFYENDKKRVYFPDFIILDTFVEIKRDDLLDENGKLLDKVKEKCLEDNNVVLWRKVDIDPFLLYCKEKYGGIDWYLPFRKEVATCEEEN